MDERKKELQKMKVTELVILANKYDISTDKKKSELIDAILNVENPPKKTRPPRNAATTKLKALRVARGVTQRELGEHLKNACGIHERTYQLYEQGVKSIDGAKIDILLNICIKLNCRLDEILENQNAIDAYNAYKEI